MMDAKDYEILCLRIKLCEAAIMLNQFQLNAYASIKADEDALRKKAQEKTNAVNRD